MKLRTGLLCIAVSLLVLARVHGAEDVSALRRQAAAAYQAKDWKAFLDSSERAHALRPDLPGLLYNLACARSLNGDAHGAIEALDRLADSKIDFGADADPDLEAARKSSGYARIAAKWAALSQPLGSATVAFTLSPPDLREGIAIDPASGDVFVGSVHERGILRRRKGGEVTPFTTESTYGVFGMAVDVKRRLLWAATSSLPEMKGYAKDDEGKTELVAFDLSSGKVKQRFAPPNDGVRHSLNDVAVSARGDVFVSDSIGGALYRLPRGGKSLETLIQHGLRSPNGLALSKDGKWLYVADYAMALYRVGLTRSPGAVARLEPVRAPASIPTIGIDGLVWTEGGLIAIQNGIRPHRVVRLVLSPDGAAIASSQILLMNDPRFDEPTLGAISGDFLLIVANSHWAKFDPRAGSVDAASVGPTEILKLPL